MTGYTSGKVVTHDPQPWELYLHNLDMTLRYAYRPDDIWESCETLTYAPRSEFDNHNPILVSFRKMQEAHPEVPIGRRASSYLASVSSMGHAINAPLSAIDHARRVLSKLAIDWYIATEEIGIRKKGE